MEPDKLNDLPFWFQVIAGAGLFFGTAAVAALGWAKKNISGGLFGEKEDTSKAVVLSAAIADSASIKQLAHAIENLILELNRRENESEDTLDRLRRDHRDLIDEMSRLTRAIRERAIL